MKWLAEMQLEKSTISCSRTNSHTLSLCQRYLYATVVAATILCNSLTMTFIATITYRMYL
jgi:hypothetical protein